MERTSRRSVAEALWPLARRKVLGLLFGPPDVEFHLREIARRTGLAPATVQREVGALAQAGLLERRRSGHQVYYRANRSSPLFLDLHRLVLKTVGLADVLRDALEPLREGVRAAFIFGSAARGDLMDHSDIDLMIIGEVTLRELTPPLGEAQATLSRPVNAVTMRPHEVAERLAAEEPFLLNVLGGPKLFLVGGQDELDAMAAGRSIAEPQDLAQ
ncbi:MAG: MarR family transcriptional regulator [Armatimonadetes bacterium]|nr:MarR family transcriptional regulator [Armatimonadota bacterium]